MIYFTTFVLLLVGVMALICCITFSMDYAKTKDDRSMQLSIIYGLNALVCLAGGITTLSSISSI